jgi:16S rRNA (cytosine967-C5)-methyltransferase
MGVLRWQLKLDHYISHYADRNTARFDLPVLIALRMGLYQLRFLSRIPPSAAVNEAVELVRFARIRSADRFVNAVLRRALREPDYDPAMRIQDSFERTAIETSHPSWLIQRWSEAFGAADTKALAHANNKAAPVSFRFTGKETDHVQIVQKLRSAGGDVVPSQIVSNAWRISGATDTLRVLMQRGEIYLQDEASQLVAHALAPQPGHYILDVCGAPGSKATHMATLTGDRAVIVTGDLHWHRLRAVATSVRVQSLTSVHCVTLDGMKNPPFREGIFDRVLVDAPCSGTGTLRRNPEIRWRIRPEDIRDLSARQKHLLSQAAKMVRPGGLLAYSTCSIEPEENEGVIQAFLEQKSGFFRFQPALGSGLTAADGSVRTFPHRHGTDGFFIAVFEKT